MISSNKLMGSTMGTGLAKDLSHPFVPFFMNTGVLNQDDAGQRQT